MSQDLQPGNITTNLQGLSGNNVEIWMGNTKIGYLQNFSGQDDYGHQPLSGIGDAHPQEFVPGMYTGTLTADRAVLRKESMFALLGGKDNQNNPFINIDGALQGKVFDVAMHQRDGKGAQGILRVWTRCTIGSSSVQVRAHTIILSNVTLHALDVQNDLSGTGFQGVSSMDDMSSSPNKSSTQ